MGWGLGLDPDDLEQYIVEYGDNLQALHECAVYNLEQCIVDYGDTLQAPNESQAAT
jgi:hypothetical protein